VQFIEHGYGLPCAQPVKVQQFRQRSGSPQELSAIAGIVPVEVGVANRLRNPGFAHLPWATHERHLAVVVEVFAQDCGIDSWPVHEDHYTEYRKMVPTVLRRATKWSRQL
jgi:hypothetical protein